VTALPAFAAMHGNDLHIRIEAMLGARSALVARSALGARSDEVVGVLGDRWKVRVSQPPEGGRANEAVRSLLAQKFGVSQRSVALVSGVASPMMVFLVIGVGESAVHACAALLSSRP
jgi:uncharacterized protein YggU (UPF0235/DUF167 family)